MKMHFTSLIRKSQQFEHISHRSGHINSHPALSFPSFLFHCLYPKLPFFTRESHSLNNYLRTSLCLRVCSQRSPDLENPLKRKSFPVFSDGSRDASACGHLTLVSASIFTRTSSLGVYVSSLFEDTCHWIYDPPR